MKDTLYKQDTRGSIRAWSVWAEGNVIYIEHGLLNGAQQLKTETVPRGLAGRTLEEQVRSRVRSRINKQLDQGYKLTLEEAKYKAGTNALGFVKPMLAKPYEKVRSIDLGEAYLQRKYDGHRCLITKQNSKIIAYSRQGKIIPSIDHIVETLDLEEGQTLDGELYCHGVPLQTIGSWIKREQEATKNLAYHVYDMVSDDKFQDRLYAAGVATQFSTQANIVPTIRAHSEDHIHNHFRLSREKGYEGSILRWGDKGYQAGARSSHLVKIKATQDAEYKVVDVHPSKDGWAILECLLPSGDTFRVLAPGTQAQKMKVLENRLEFLGRYVTVEFANLTRDGIPFHPRATRWLDLI